MRLENFEELKKQVHCENCHKIYDDGSFKYVHTGCQHHVCDSCLNPTLSSLCCCPVCNCSSEINCSRFKHDMTSLLKVYAPSVAESAGENKRLKREISILKQQQTVYETTQKDLQNKILKLEKEQEMSRKSDEVQKKNAGLKHNQAVLEAQKEDHHKCCECEITDSEKNMQLCATCHGLKFKDIEGVKKSTLCSTCAIKKHIRKGHHTVDLYPYLSAYNFSSHKSKIVSQSKGVKNTRVSLNNTVSRFNALSINASENYDVLTDMARRSKSTKHQLEFIEKMEAFSNEAKSIHTGADSELKKHTEFLQDSVTKIKEWCNARKDNCVEKSEIIKLEASATFNDSYSDFSYSDDEYSEAEYSDEND